MKNRIEFAKIAWVVTALMVMPLAAQERKLSLDAISVGYGYTTTSVKDSRLSDIRNPKVEGPVLNLEITTRYAHKHLFSAYFNHASNEVLFNGDQAQYISMNLTYGRELELAKNLNLQGHLGLGLFIYDDAQENPYFDIPELVLGFPVHLKVLYSISPDLAVGIHPNANFNSSANAFAGNLVVQLKL